MRHLRAWFVRLGGIFNRRRRDRELADELESHLAMHVDDNLRAGMTSEEARRVALARLGGVEATKEAYRERRGHPLLDSVPKDLGYGLRLLRRNPGYAAVAVLTLALGVGANTAVFSVVNGVLLRPLPYADADAALVIAQTNLETGEVENGASPANFVDWRERAGLFAMMAAAEPFSYSMTGDGEPEALRAWLVTEDFFPTLGVDAFLGRTFLPDEYRAGDERVLVIGYELWRRRFGADRGVVGRTLLLNGQPYAVVGVMPPEFQFPTERGIWAPRVAREGDKQIRGSGYMPVVGRLRPGTTVEQARGEMDAVATRLAELYPQTNRGRGVSIVSLPDRIVGRVRPALLVLLGAVGIVLLIACVNVVNLVLVRAAGREREFAVRAALGAGRSRLVRQLLTESTVLAVVGGACGVLLAHVGVAVILTLGAGELPRSSAIGIDGRVLAFALVVSTASALVFGLAPALHFFKPDLADSLKKGGRGAAGGAGHRFRNSLVVSEVALALILMVGAGLLARSFVRILDVDPGFTAEDALALEVHAWGRNRTPAERAAFFEQTVDRIAALPGVRAAGAVSALPFHDNPISVGTTFAIEGQVAPAPGQEPTANATVATADYFAALGIALRRGRFYTRFDRSDGAPVVLVNETLARRYWPDGDAVGRKITVRYMGESTTREIVGVVGDVRHEGLDSDPHPELFLPHLQEPYGSMTYVVRTDADPEVLLPAVKSAVWAVNPNQPFSSVATLRQLVSRSLAQRRFSLALLSSFAAIALVLAGVGVYGLISFVISQRTHEIGLRMALGARRADVLKLVLGRGMALVSAGVALGLAGAIGLTRLMSSLLYGVDATDPPTFAATALLLVGVALLACYRPARRALGVDPAVALRHE